MEIRALRVGDLEQARALAVEAFGPWPAGATMPPLPTEYPAGRHDQGAFDGDRLVAKARAHDYESWWHGHRVPTCGVAGVAIAAEHRGGGLLRQLFEPLLDGARERAQVVSTLYPTAPGIYRSLGYEVIGSYDTVSVPTAELTRLAAPSGTTTRRAGVDDVPAVKGVYDAWAAEQNGPLTRTGPLFGQTDAELLDELTVTVAVEGSRTVGFMSWQREEGYGPQARLRVHDLVSLTGDGYRALWRLAGSFASVTGLVHLSTSGLDPARLVLPAMTWDVVSRHPYMLRVLDVAGALSTLAPVPGLTGTASLSVAGDRLGVLDGHYRLDLAAGSCERVGSGDGPVLTPQGLALAYAGAQTCGNLRLLGHLSGPTTYDAVLDAVLAGRPVHVRDYF